MYMYINLITAIRFIEDYLTNCGMDTADYDIDRAGRELRDIAQFQGVSDYDEIDGDVFTQILIDSAL